MLVYSHLLKWITNLSFFYRAEGNKNWYEAAIVPLYQGMPQTATTHTIAAAHVVRGKLLLN